ncbi:MAG: hypothetical protein E6K58_00070 [Nitrospirae bacterium]|nr:MAG: hypothetical protein E6K58_00070 [Nitrospirota bacterium]
MARKFAYITLLVVLLGPLAAFADDDDGNNKLKAVPFAFVGTAAQCGGPAGARIVTSAWLGGMGLPDNGGDNFNATTPGDPPNKRDPHLGLLLNKNGATPICSSAGAEITGVKGKTVTSTFHVGLDYRNGGHCGAGAPRFNIDTDMGFFFVGCSAAPKSNAPQDPAEWTRTRSVLTACGSECFNVTTSLPGSIPVGAKINSIDIVFDEGTDNPVAGDPEGIGLAVVDNIDINGRLITQGSGIEDGIDRYKGKDNDKHDD